MPLVFHLEMPYISYLEIAAAAYLLGSIPFGFVLMRLVRKQDIRSIGSGNIGATNVLRSGSKGLGALTFLLDAAKGYTAVLAGEWLARAAGPTVSIREAAALAALCAILGHIYPIWLGFKGGKGVATGFGVFLALLPWAALSSLGIFVLVLALSRIVSLASIVGAAAFPFLGLALYRADYSLRFGIIVFFLAGLIIAKHHQNIRRLIAGKEYRFGASKADAEAESAPKGGSL